MSARPNISESHSGTSTRVPHCITGFCLLVTGRVASLELAIEEERQARMKMEAEMQELKDMLRQCGEAVSRACIAPSGSCSARTSASRPVIA